MSDEIEIFDSEVAGVFVEGLSVNQIKMLKKFYQTRTGDMDLEKLSEYAKLAF